MQYKILTAERHGKLATRVYQHLLDGWVLQGGVGIAMSMSGQEYCQAIVKEDK